MLYCFEQIKKQKDGELCLKNYQQGFFRLLWLLPLQYPVPAARNLNRRQLTTKQLTRWLTVQFFKLFAGTSIQ